MQRVPARGVDNCTKRFRIDCRTERCVKVVPSIQFAQIADQVLTRFFTGEVIERRPP